MNDRAPTGGGTRKRHALELFGGLPRHYDRVAAVLSFGQDPRWRRTMVAAVDARPGERVLDVATGTGLVAQAVVPPSASARTGTASTSFFILSSELCFRR